MSAKIGKMSKFSAVTVWPRRGFAAHAAVKHSDKGIKANQLTQAKLPNGMVIASIENLSPISRIGIFIDAGARYEPHGQLGLTHCLRNAAGLTTRASTIFGITRHIEEAGGRFTASTNRDHLVYVLEMNRDRIGENIDYVADTILRPAFKHWQLTDYAYRMKVDLGLMKHNPVARLMEGLHKVSFRGGLANSIYSPKFMIGHHSGSQLSKYMDDHVVANKLAIVGLGVEQEFLQRYAEKHFNVSTGGPTKVPSKFGGGEFRKETGSDLTYIAVGGEGASVTNSKEMLALAIFQNILGCSSRVKYTSGSHSRLSRAAAKVAEKPYAVSSMNISYTDAGLFGFSLVASPHEVHKVVKAVVTEMRNVAKNINDKDVNVAKNQLKASIRLTAANPHEFLGDLGTLALALSKIPTIDEIEKTIDGITAQDVASVSAKVMKSKGAMSSVGSLHNTPYLDELI